MRLRERVRLHVLTGFLGSGKSTLLRAFLQDDGARRRTAVLINEFGAVPIDHALVRSVSPHAQSLAGGCACCTVDTALRQALLSILRQVESGETPDITDVVLETSGMADPSRILGTIAQDESLAEYVQVTNCVTCVEAGTGLALIERYAEMRQQIACASRVVLTKPDLCSEQSAEASARLLAGLNPLAEIRSGPEFTTGPADLFGPARGPQPAGSAAPVRHSRLQTFQAALDPSIGWAAFSVWLTSLMWRHGDRILRFKGVIPLSDTGRALVLQSVRHRVSAPEHLELGMTGQDGACGLVFICDGELEQAVLGSLRKFQAFAIETAVRTT